ncbi:MAG: PqqD family protein [Actinomycetota bacterium]
MAYRRADGVTFEVSGERAMLLDAAGATLTTLNPTGTAVWRALDGSRGPEELTALLAEVHPDVPATALRSDVEDFLQVLAADELIEPVDRACRRGVEIGADAER